MENIKTYTGEVVDSASPQISEAEAIENAGFGRYKYDPTMQQNTVSLPGWQGYSTSGNPNAFYQQPPMGYIGQAMNGYIGYPQQNYGIGMNPYYMNMMNNQYGGQPVYQGYNPYYYQRQVQQQYQQPQYIQIPPLNYRGEYLPPMDYENKLSNLATQYWMKEQEQAVENQNKYNNNYNFGYNYYGSMMYNNFYNPLRQEASNLVREMQEEARNNRINFNLNLAKLAFNLTYGKDNYDEQKVEEIYKGRTIENPYSSPEISNQLYFQQRFQNAQTFDNSSYYQNFHAQISAQHNSIINPNADLKEMFNNAGTLWATYEMEDEMHRRRNLTGTYNSQGYKYFIQKSIAERKNGSSIDQRFNSYQNPSIIGGSIPAPGTNVMNIYPGNPRKMKDQSHVVATPSLDKDGNIEVTLSLPQNWGSHAGETYVVNSNEAAYDKKREQFNQFLDSIPKSIYTLDGGG